MNTSETKVDVLSQYGRFAVENDGHRVTIVDEETLCVNVAVVREPKAAERDSLRARVAELERGISAEAIEFARNASRLLHGFMLDCNAVGVHAAGENLARGIKHVLSAKDPTP